jgi:hypothetical protein
VREQRSANAAELRAAMADWSRRLHASGISERAQVRCRHVWVASVAVADYIVRCCAIHWGHRRSWAKLRRAAHSINPKLQVVLRRDRQCVAVKAGRQGELPRGSVTLAASSTCASPCSKIVQPSMHSTVASTRPN